MLAIWKFSCNSFFKVSSNSSTYLSFIGYLDELETKQKFKSVSYPADFLRKYLDSLILNLTKGKERYVELLDETLKKVIFPIH
jgi:hypothetical protein